MELSEIEKNFEEIKNAGKNVALAAEKIDSLDIMTLATIMNFIALEIGLLIRCNVEILRHCGEGE